MFWGKKVHVLTEAVTEHPRVMIIEVVVFVFGDVWVVGWYLYRALLGPPIDSSVYVNWELYGSLVVQDINVTHQFVIWGPLHTLEHWMPSWYHMNELRVIHHSLVPYEWAVAGPQDVFVTPVLWWFFVWVMSWFFLN